MPDLNELDAAGATKIVGSDETGVEQTPVRSSGTGKLNVNNIINNDGDQGSMSISSSLAVEVKVGVSPLPDRISLTLYNSGSQKLFWGYTSSVTAATGTEIFKKQTVVWDVGPNQSVYVIAASGTGEARITEGA